MRIYSTLPYSIILSALLCSACSTALPTVEPYKLDVQQGNVVTPKMLLQLRPGMTKSQVRFIMGTPLVQDSFHSNRWDYVYQMREKGKVTERRQVTLDFEGDVLKAVRSEMPKGDESNKDVNSNKGTSGARALNSSGTPKLVTKALPAESSKALHVYDSTTGMQFDTYLHFAEDRPRDIATPVRPTKIVKSSNFLVGGLPNTLKLTRSLMDF